MDVPGHSFVVQITVDVVVIIMIGRFRERGLVSYGIYLGNSLQAHGGGPILLCPKFTLSSARPLNHSIA